MWPSASFLFVLLLWGTCAFCVPPNNNLLQDEWNYHYTYLPDPTSDDLTTMEKTVGFSPPLEQQSWFPPLNEIPFSHSDIPGTAGHSPAFGDPRAPIKIFFFTDIQCPVCKRAIEPLKRLVRNVENLSPHVQLVFMNNALPMHKLAAPAAVACLAAARQKLFWPYFETLSKEPRLSESSWLTVAKKIDGLDVEKFRQDLELPELEAQVLYETKMAEALELYGTPSLAINGILSKGWGSYILPKGTVRRLVDKLPEDTKTGYVSEPWYDLFISQTLAVNKEQGHNLLQYLFASNVLSNYVTV